jgi:hypothetical protein
MHDFKLKRNCIMAALSGFALVLTATTAMGQGHGGSPGPAFAGGTTGAGASFGAGGPAVVPPVIHSSGYGYGSKSYSSNGPYSYGGTHSGTSHTRSSYSRTRYPLAYYAYPYFVTPSGGWAGDPALLGNEPIPDQSVYNELDILHQQIDQLRTDQGYVASSRSSYAESVQEPPEKKPAALILVFRDGTRTEVQDYAVVGQTFWDLSSNGTRKFPVSQLDLQASIKANDARGLEFPEVKSAQ